MFSKKTHIFSQVKEQVQADVVIISAAQDERLLKILQGQGTCAVMLFDFFIYCLQLF